jgi:hypothetical protein
MTLFSATFQENQTLLHTDLNRVQAETEAAIEAYSDVNLGDGVETAAALAPSISGATVALAAGYAYLFGVRFSGDTAVDFTALPNGSYYGYLDAATGGYLASTVRPGANAGLVLFSADWDGAAITNLVDRRVKAERLRLNAATATADYQASSCDEVVLADATAASLTVTLPYAADCRACVLTVKKTDAGANAVTVAAKSGETVDGSASVTLAAQYDAVRLYCDGAAWWKI